MSSSLSSDSIIIKSSWTQAQFSSNPALPIRASNKQCYLLWNYHSTHPLLLFSLFPFYLVSFSLSFFVKTFAPKTFTTVQSSLSRLLPQQHMPTSAPILTFSVVSLTTSMIMSPSVPLCQPQYSPWWKLNLWSSIWAFSSLYIISIFYFEFISTLNKIKLIILSFLTKLNYRLKKMIYSFKDEKIFLNKEEEMLIILLNFFFFGWVFF